MKYRLLEKGEVIQGGDEYWSSDRLMWEPFTASVGNPEGSYHPSRRPIPDPAWIKLSDQPPTYPCWVSDGVEVFVAEKNWHAALISTEAPNSVGGTMDFDRRVTHWQPIGPKPAPPVPEKSAEDEALEAYQAFLKDRPNSSILICKDGHAAFKAGIEFARKGAK